MSPNLCGASNLFNSCGPPLPVLAISFQLSRAAAIVFLPLHGIKECGAVSPERRLLLFLLASICVWVFPRTLVCHAGLDRGCGHSPLGLASSARASCSWPLASALPFCPVVLFEEVMTSTGCISVPRLPSFLDLAQNGAGLVSAAGTPRNPSLLGLAAVTVAACCDHPVSSSPSTKTVLTNVCALRPLWNCRPLPVPQGHQ